MADIVPTLFGLTPESYQREQDTAAEARAIRFAGMTPMQRANYGIYRGAGQLGGALGRALGGEDPELARITARQQIASQLDFNDPTSIQRAREALRQSNDATGLLQLDAIIRQAQESGALVRQREAAAGASEAAAKRERGPTGDVAKAIRAGEITRALQTPGLTDLERSGFQAELDVLRPAKEKEPTTDALTNARAFAATKGQPGTPEYNTAFQNKFSELIAKAPAPTPSVGTDREAIAQAAPFNKPYAQLTPDEKARVNALAEQQAISRAQAGAAVSPIAVVGPSGAPTFVSRAQAIGMTPAAEARQFLPVPLQKDESKDLELIDSLAMRREALKDPLTLLTPDPVTKKPPLELGPAKNLRYIAQNATGESTSESRAYAALQRAIQEATNLKTDAAKGVQTDKDVLRFANELIAAFGKNDTKTTLDALTNFNKATQSALEKTQARIDARRKGQGVTPLYGGATAGTPQNPIKLSD